MQGVVPNNEAVVSMALQDFGQATAIIMCLGMVLNIVLARFSRMHYIFLTGHHTFYMAAMLAIILHIGGLDGWMLYISSACLLGLIMVLSPAYCQPTMRKVTGSDSVALGHFGGVGYWLSGIVGKLFASDRENSTEKLQFSKRLIFLRDNFVGGILGLILLGLINASLVPLALILPGVVPHFFCGATAGVFGNAEGGIKGCVAGAFAHGLLITFLPAFCMPVFTSMGFTSAMFSDADFSVMALIFGNVALNAQGLILTIICIVCFLLPIFYNFVAPKHEVSETVEKTTK